MISGDRGAKPLTTSSSAPYTSLVKKSRLKEYNKLQTVMGKYVFCLT